MCASARQDSPCHSHPRQSAVDGLALAPLPIPIRTRCVDSSGLWRQAPIVEHVLVEDPSVQCGSPQLAAMDYTSAMHWRKDRLAIVRPSLLVPQVLARPRQ